MKLLYHFLLFCPVFLLSQKTIKIIDSETSKPIKDVRVIAGNTIYYSNDDGNILLDNTSSSKLNVSISGYTTLTIDGLPEIIKLSPKYQNIEEVTIAPIDFAKILKEVSKNYSKIYYTQPISYNVTIKQKNYENNRMKLLMIADGKLWQKDGYYNAKDAFNDRFNNFIQLQIDYLRYLKSEKPENFLKIRKQDTGRDIIGDLFFSYELNRSLQIATMRKGKASGKLLSDDGTLQDISFIVKTDVGLLYKGQFTYHKLDKAITNFVLNFYQSDFKPRELKDENKTEYKYQLGNGTLSFEMYKNGDYYYPTKIGVYGDGFKYITDQNSFESSIAREMIFKSFSKSNDKGLSNPVKIDKAYWLDLKQSEDKGNTLLSKEEQEFIDKQSVLQEE